jgi:hypothetical protein
MMLNDEINESIVQKYLLIVGHESFETFPFLAEYLGTKHKTTAESNTMNRSLGSKAAALSRYWLMLTAYV